MEASLHLSSGKRDDYFRRNTPDRDGHLTDVMLPTGRKPLCNGYGLSIVAFSTVHWSQTNARAYCVESEII